MVIDMTDTKRIFQVTTILGTLFLIGLILYFLSQGYFTDSTKLQALLNQTGIFAPLLFILLQIFQVIIPIIPGGASSALGIVAFGPIWGFVYNYAGLVIGSILAFLLVKKYGKTFILKVCDQNTYDKYIGWLDKGKKFDRFFAAAPAQSAPDFPDWSCNSGRGSHNGRSSAPAWWWWSRSRCRDMRRPRTW